MIERDESLDYHSGDRPGKIELRLTKACLTPREMRLAYLPGASFPAREIMQDPRSVFKYSTRGNLVAVVTNGTALPGLGDVGPLAAKPMQEGIAILFKRLADIDVFDLELNTKDAGQFIETVKILEPGFGGINLKDIRAPEGLDIFDKLRSSLNIPVFHENLYSTAVGVVAALINALELAEKRIDGIRVVICGAGTVGTGCARLILRLGVPPDNLLVYDIKGLLHADRTDLLEYQFPFVRKHPARDLRAGLKGADVFIGASAAGVLDLGMIRSMNRFPIVFALATPEPEIPYDEAKGSRDDIIFATALSRFPNAVTDLLSFPYIFRGALDVLAKTISENMLIAAARALADLAREDVVEEVERAYGHEHFSFGPDYLIPKEIDPRIFVRESMAVGQAAIDEGIASRPLKPEVYRDSLTARLGTGREFMRRITLRAGQQKFRVVFSECDTERILRACHILVDEGIARPILLGREQDIGRKLETLGIDLGGVTIIDPGTDQRLDRYAEEYFHMRKRHGVIRPAAVRRLQQPDSFAAMMVHHGDADMMIAGVSTHYTETLATIIEIIGPATAIGRISSHHVLLLPKDVVFLADCTVNIDPDAEQLAEIALLTARMCRTLGIEPRVAMLSFSNFGSVDHTFTKKVRKATEMVKSRAPELKVDGEMQLATARDSAIRREYFPFSELDKEANVLVFPDLQSANLTLHSMQCMGEAKPIGPILMGTRLPVHLLQYGASVEDVVNLTAIAIVEATPSKPG